MSTTSPKWTELQCDGPAVNMLDVLGAIRWQREAAVRLRQAEAAARAEIANAERNEERRQREADAAAWRAYMGYDDDSGCYEGCGCDEY